MGTAAQVGRVHAVTLQGPPPPGPCAWSPEHFPRSLGMERGREIPVAQGHLSYPLTSTQDWRQSGSPRSFPGKLASSHMTNIPCKRAIFVGARGTLVVGRAERLCPQRDVSPWRSNTHALSQTPPQQPPTEPGTQQTGLGQAWRGRQPGSGWLILQLAKRLGQGG